MEHPAVCWIKKNIYIITHLSKSGHYSVHQASVVLKELAVSSTRHWGSALEVLSLMLNTHFWEDSPIPFSFHSFFFSQTYILTYFCEIICWSVVSVKKKRFDLFYCKSNASDWFHMPEGAGRPPEDFSSLGCKERLFANKIRWFCLKACKDYWAFHLFLKTAGNSNV